MPTPLLIVGHKRSGTTLLAKLLNEHPEIFIANETDILWILYQQQRQQQQLSTINAYPMDGQVGLNATLSRYSNLLEKNVPPAQLYTDVLNQAMFDGFMGFPPQSKSQLKYIGDQKPFQQADPLIIQFCQQIFPAFYLIHIVRHPFRVIHSCMHFGPSNDGGWMWGGLSSREIFQRWVKVENWVHQIRHQTEIPIVTIRYEDLINQSEHTIKHLFSFLELTWSASLLTTIINSIRGSNKEAVQFEIPDEAKDVMARHEYSHTPV